MKNPSTNDPTVNEMQELVGLARSTAETAEAAKATKRQLDAIAGDLKSLEVVSNALRSATRVTEDTSARLSRDPGFVAAVLVRDEVELLVGLARVI